MNQGPAPRISVVVPTHRRPEQLARCLAALARQDYPRDRFKVIVVDDGSPNPPTSIVDRFQQRLSVELVPQAHAGPAVARNTGAEKASGELIAFTDDDCAPDAGWLRALGAAHAAAPEVALGGLTVNALTDNPYSEASQLLVDYLYSYFNRDPDAARFLTSNNLAFPRQAFLEIGGFASDFPLAAGEDREICDRWVSLGRSIRYVAEARVDHYHALDPRRFVRQHFGYGRGGYEYQRARTRRGDETGIEPLRFYADLLSYPFRRLEGLPAVVASGLFVVSQVANAAGFFFERGLAARAERRPEGR